MVRETGHMEFLRSILGELEIFSGTEPFYGIFSGRFLRSKLQKTVTIQFLALLQDLLEMLEHGY
jgi:hypothetical protein